MTALATLSLEMWIALAILALAILLFVTEWLRVDVVALSVVVTLMLTGLLTPREAFEGFANPAVLTIASLFIVGGAVMQTGLAGLIGQRVLRVAGDNALLLTFLIMIAVAFLSSIMSDTGTVAVLLPAVVSLAWNAGLDPGQLLMPLSFGALLGGATTLIGTPPNLIVSDTLRQAGFTPLGFFAFTPIGLLLLIAGLLYVLFIGRRLLPRRGSLQRPQRTESPEDLVELHDLGDRLSRLEVTADSALANQTLGGSRLRRDFGVTVLQILHVPPPRSVVRLGDQRLVLHSETPTLVAPTAETVARPGDVLIVYGTASGVRRAAARWRLQAAPCGPEDRQRLSSGEFGLAEILLPPRSALLGRSLDDLHFSRLYRLMVLAIRRPGSEGPLDVRHALLRFGDTLLVHGTWRNLRALRAQSRDFLVMGEARGESDSGRPRRAVVALGVLLAMLVAMVTNVIPVAAASMSAALLMILSGCLTIDDAYEAVDWKSIVLIAGMLPMSIALQKVGLVNLAAEGLIGALGQADPLLVLASLFLLTAGFTQVLSNTATTVLVAPIALSAAQQMGLHPQAFMMAVAIAASMAFASPVASPANTLVMGAGNYRFSDYVKVGIPMILVGLGVTTLCLPLLWPL